MHRFIALLVVFAFSQQGAFVVGQADTQSSRARKPAVENANSGTTTLFTVTGSGAASSNGDYVSGTLNQPYRFFIEVPQGVSDLVVDIFDADVGAGGASDASGGRDRARSSYNSAVTYTLLDPAGAVQATLTCNNTVSAPCADNLWVNLGSVVAATPGHWEIRVDMSSAVTSGDDINAFGLRAHDGDPDGGGTELNIYADSFLPMGVNADLATKNYTLYPYITSGCSFSKNDFDYDHAAGRNVGSMNFTSGTFSQSFASVQLSGNDAWRRDPVSGWTSSQTAGGYGIWTGNFAISVYPNSGNYTTVYLTNSQAANNPPTSNPAANSFRVYLPTDDGTAPLKPHLSQQFVQVSGPNPIPVGQTGRMRVSVTFSNPTAHPVTFSAASNVITSNVPGSGVVYGGGFTASQGSAVSQPSVGGTGDVVWDPGIVAPGATAILLYDVDVTPASVSQTLPITGDPASNGTRAQYVDETGSAEPRATHLFGGLCGLSVTEGVVNQAPTSAPGLINGRVLVNEYTGLGNATVRITDSNGNTRVSRTGAFGYFRFEGLLTGETYVISVTSRGHQFDPQVISLSDSVADVTFMPVNGGGSGILGRGR